MLLPERQPVRNRSFSSSRPPRGPVSTDRSPLPDGEQVPPGQSRRNV